MSFYDMENLTGEDRYEILAALVPEIKRAAKSNDTIKHMRNVQKGRGSDSQAVVAGISIIESVTASDIKIGCLIVCPDEIYSERAQECFTAAAIKAEEVLAVSPATFALLGAKKTSSGLAALIEMQFKKIGDIKPAGINIVMDSLELPGNIGTIMRTADGAGLSSVIVTNEKAKLNNPTLIAASRGAFAGMDIVVDSVANIADWAKKHGVRIFLADTRAQKVHTEADLSGKVCFVLGCERYGIDQKWYEKEHELLKIPMLGNCDSLNVGVAGSILIYEALRQQTD